MIGHELPDPAQAQRVALGSTLPPVLLEDLVRDAVGSGARLYGASQIVPCDSTALRPGSLPLVAGGQVRGCMGLFAAARDSIGGDEPKLLIDMAGNLSHGLTALGRDGQPFTRELEGLLAICLQHEIDHLDGKLFVDYISPLKRQRIRKKLEKAQRQRA